MIQCLCCVLTALWLVTAAVLFHAVSSSHATVAAFCGGWHSAVCFLKIDSPPLFQEYFINF